MKDAIVLYPAPGMGHIVSMVELGKLILQQSNHQCSIIILLTTGFWDIPTVISYINSVSQAHPSISFRHFPSITVDTSPTRSPEAICFEFLRLHAPNALHCLQQTSKEFKICAFVIDMFCTTALSKAKELKIPTFYFYTSGAAALAAFLQLPTVHEKTATGSFKDQTSTVFHFQGLPPLKATHMPEPLLDIEDPAYSDFMYFCSNFPKSDGILVNTFDDLEPLAIRALASGGCVAGAPTPPTYCIGPLMASGDQAQHHDCLSWLDKQPSRSVVFLCFGSRGSFSRAQIKEIASGLEKSGQRFLWVVKIPLENEKTKQTDVDHNSDIDLDYLLPKGFLERVKDRGMVVKSWAPQIAVLNRESVGGFVSHCGWNSVLEAVSAGVPIIAWPLYAEQHLNRNVLVEDIKIAIPVEQREEENGFVTGAELERRVRELMDSEKGQEIREKSRKMKEAALAAWGESGSSIKALAELIEIWKQ